MLLKSLELHGIQVLSPTRQTTFGKGITAVVGPNGSGKSNISDAVRWVLGEQSTKRSAVPKWRMLFLVAPKRGKPRVLQRYPLRSTMLLPGLESTVTRLQLQENIIALGKANT